MKAVLVEEFKRKPQVQEVVGPVIRGPFDALVRILKGISVTGSIVGTRQDLHEALTLAARGLVKCNSTQCANGRYQ